MKFGATQRGRYRSWMSFQLVAARRRERQRRTSAAPSASAARKPDSAADRVRAGCFLQILSSDRAGRRGDAVVRFETPRAPRNRDRRSIERPSAGDRYTRLGEPPPDSRTPNSPDLCGKDELGTAPRRVLDNAIGYRQPPIEANGSAELCGIALFAPPIRHDTLRRKFREIAVAACHVMTVAFREVIMRQRSCLGTTVRRRRPADFGRE